MVTEFRLLPIWATFARLTEDNKVYIKISGNLAIPKKLQPSEESKDTKPYTISPLEKVFKFSKKETKES